MMETNNSQPISSSAKTEDETLNDQLAELYCYYGRSYFNVKPKRVNHYQRELRGFSNNKYRGHQSQRQRGLRGGTYGPASRCRRVIGDEREKIVERLKAEGTI